jgi:hypothetical protein
LKARGKEAMMIAIREGATEHGISGCMVDVIQTGLSEKGHAELASLVELGDTGRPQWNWPRLGRAPTTEEIHAVHAAILRAYEAYAPEEIGEETGQFTKSPARWCDAIRRARRAFDCGMVTVIPPECAPTR